MSEIQLSDDLEAIAATTATEAGRYLATVTEVAAGTAPDAALALLLLAVTDALAVGARLGAIVDVVPQERFEPDAGPDADLDPLHRGLANALDGLDTYSEVTDPLINTEVAEGSLVDDLVTVAAALTQGLAHFEAGRVDEALWWWQFSYLSSWGERAAAALRVLIDVIAHVRFDADDDVVAAAEFDALHP